MTTDQSSQEQSDNSPPRAGLVVGAIGVLLAIVLLCGFLLRNAGNQQHSAGNENNLTSVPPDTVLTDDDSTDDDKNESAVDGQPGQATSNAESAHGASLSTPPAN